jgi:hypothetical protein
MDNGVGPLDYYPQYPSYVQALRDEPIDFTARFSLPIEDNDLYNLIQQKRKTAQDGLDVKRPALSQPGLLAWPAL